MGGGRSRWSRGPHISSLRHKNRIVCARLPARHLLGEAKTAPKRSEQHPRLSWLPSHPYVALGRSRPVPTLNPQITALPGGQTGWGLSQPPVVPPAGTLQTVPAAPAPGNKQKPSGQKQPWPPSWARADPVLPEGDGCGCPPCPLARSWTPTGTWLIPSVSLPPHPTPPIPAAKPASFSPTPGTTVSMAARCGGGGTDWLTLLPGWKLRLAHSYHLHGAWARVGI